MICVGFSIVGTERTGSTGEREEEEERSQSIDHTGPVCHATEIRSMLERTDP